jgi:hypothetical protein
MLFTRFKDYNNYMGNAVLISRAKKETIAGSFMKSSYLQCAESGF